MNTTRSFAVASSLVLGLLVACGGSAGTGFGGPDAGGGVTPDTGVHMIGTGTGSGTPDAFVGSTDTGATGTGTGTGTGAGTQDGSTAPETGGGQCAPSCKTDSDCQNSCPAVTGALNCCDTQSGVCFTSSETVCPDQVQDASTGTSDTGTTGGY